MFNNLKKLWSEADVLRSKIEEGTGKEAFLHSELEKIQEELGKIDIATIVEPQLDKGVEDWDTVN